VKPLKYYIRRLIFGKASDRRRHLRKPLSLKVTNQKSGFFTYYISSDISVGGMFLRADEPLPVGTMLDLEFTLPRSAHTIRTSAGVVRIVAPSPELTYPSGMGIRFHDLKPEDRDEIEKFVNQPN
jgi:type IV pilus assembly protein PilZ